MKMKNIGSLFILAVALILSTLASCGKGGKDSAHDSAAVDTDTIAAEEVEPAVYLCSDSIFSASGASVLVGTPVGSLSESVAGLYDGIEREADESYSQLHFKLGDEYIFTAIDFGEGKIDLIMANTFRVKAMVSGKPSDVSLSVPFTDVIALPGSLPEWCDYDDSGMWYWTCDGLWFAPDQSHLTPGLSTSLYNEEKMPVPSDFDESVTVGYLGTGCPF